MIKNRTVNILGTNYNIKVIKPNKEMKKNKWVGLCDNLKKEILISDLSDKYDLNDAQANLYQKETLRHEIIHAFYSESGLQDSCLAFDGPWAKNEEMVDWLAIQMPKIVETMKSVDCL